MAEESRRKRLREEGTCPICMEYFRDPVMLTCGHNFCRGCITKSWDGESEEAPCPQCREKVQTGSLRENKQLASLIQIAMELSDAPKQEGICEFHQEPLKLFCQDDGAPICVVCDRSKEHRSHVVVPLEEAAQDIKDRISSSLENLRKMKENILVYEVQNEKESQDLLKQVEEEREKTTAAFRELRQCLDEQEKLQLDQMEEVEKEIKKRRDEHLASLSAELSSLDSLIEELEEKQQQQQQQQPVNELLQNLGNILQRCKKESFENPVAFPVGLKWKIHDFADINPFLECIKEQFQESLVYGLQLQKVDVILDQDTAHPQLILSEDRRSVGSGERWQNLPNNPKRFDTWHFVLGQEGFSSGRHSWEVSMGSEERWAVGVARKSVRRKGKFDYSPKDGILCMGKWEGKYKICNPPEYTTLSPSEVLKRIRVTVNCAVGRVAFFDADTAAQLFVFSEASFCGETLLPFFFVAAGGRLMLSS